VKSARLAASMKSFIGTAELGALLRRRDDIYSKQKGGQCYQDKTHDGISGDKNEVEI
jgi:hypothetical protein